MCTHACHCASDSFPGQSKRSKSVTLKKQLQTETAKGMKGREATNTHKHDRPGCRWDPRSSPGCIYCTEGFPWHRETGWSRGWANQHEEKPVAKLQPTTCVISQICGDNQQHKFLTKVWTHSDHSHQWVIQSGQSHTPAAWTQMCPRLLPKGYTHPNTPHIHISILQLLTAEADGKANSFKTTWCWP